MQQNTITHINKHTHTHTYTKICNICMHLHLINVDLINMLYAQIPENFKNIKNHKHLRLQKYLAQTQAINKMLKQQKIFCKYNFTPPPNLQTILTAKSSAFTAIN